MTVTTTSKTQLNSNLGDLLQGLGEALGDFELGAEGLASDLEDQGLDAAGVRSLLDLFNTTFGAAYTQLEGAAADL